MMTKRNFRRIATEEAFATAEQFEALREVVANTREYDPDVFLAAAAKIDAEIENCFVVGDSPWDLYAAQRAHALSIGLLTGGFSEEDLRRAGAYRVFEDPADLLEHLDEVAVRPGG